MRKLLFSVLIVALMPLAGPAVGAGDMGKRAAGEWCTSCHLIDDAGTGTDGAPSFHSLATRPGTTDTTLKTFLAAPHGRMPDFDLSRPYINEIVGYILSLGGK